MTSSPHPPRQCSSAHPGPADPDVAPKYRLLPQQLGMAFDPTPPAPGYLFPSATHPFVHRRSPRFAPVHTDITPKIASFFEQRHLASRSQDRRVLARSQSAWCFQAIPGASLGRCSSGMRIGRIYPYADPSLAYDRPKAPDCIRAIARPYRAPKDFPPSYHSHSHSARDDVPP